MAEATQISFTHQEVVEALVKKHGIHEGIWQLTITFGFSATNIEQSDSKQTLPAGIIPVLSIGLRRADKVTNLSVDAAIVNPVSAIGASPIVGERTGRKKRG